MNLDCLRQHFEMRTWKPMGIVGPHKLPLISELFEKIKLDKNGVKRVLDVGGNHFTYKFLRDAFGCEIVSLNLFKEALVDRENSVVGDAVTLPFHDKFDVIVAMDLIEHLWSPDDFIVSCKSCLRKGGFLVITTPNLAAWYNRIFLLFGFSLSNYHPSFKHRTGNPFLEKLPGDHKSVFTLGGLKELLGIYGLEIIHVKGYSYGERGNISAGGRWLIRDIVDKIIPIGMKEGILIACRNG